MVWVEVVLAVLKLVLDLPAVQDWLKRIFGALSLAHPLQATREAERVLAAIREKSAQVASGNLSAECPLEKLALELEAKYKP